MLNVDSEREIREAVENNEYVALSYVRELLDEVDRLRKLAYIGEHHFPDLTYKARLEETVVDLRETQALLENTLDSHKEGAWMARALDAERHRDVLRDQLKYAESYMEKQLFAVKQECAELRDLKSAIADLRVLRSSCEDSNAGDFRVHLCEREFDALCATVSAYNLREEKDAEYSKLEDEQ